MLRVLRTKTFRIVGVLALFVVVYAIAGFVVAPRLIRSALLEDIPRNLGVTPAVGDIRINPFLFHISVNDFSLVGAGGEKLLGFQRLYVDFELSSLWRRAYSFGRIEIATPYVGAVVAADGALNLMQLRPKSQAAPTPEQTHESLPAIRIGLLKVSQGTVSYEDRSRPDVFAARLEPINMELSDFTTGVEGGRFSFTGVSKLGERIEWHGHVSVQPIESDGEFRVDGLQVHTLWEYLQDRLNFVVNSGSINLAANYRFSAGNPANLQVELPHMTLTDLAVRPKGADLDWITVPSLDVTGTSVDLAQREAHVDRVALQGVRLESWLEPDGSLNLSKLAAVTGPPARPSTSGSTPAAATTAATAPASTGRPPTLTATPPTAAGAPWRFGLREFDVRDASIAVEDRSVQPAVKSSLSSVALQVNGLSQDLSKPVSLSFDTRINGQGSLTVNGDVTPQPLAANLAVKLTGIDLTVLQPYIAAHSAMTLSSGALRAEGKLHYGAQPNMPQMQFVGNLGIDRLHTVDNTLHDDFINWDGLEISGVNYTQGPDRLAIDQVLARKLYARVIIEADESLNVKRVLAGPGQGVAVIPVAAAAASPDATTAASSDAATAVPPHANTTAHAARHAAALAVSKPTPGPPSRKPPPIPGDPPGRCIPPARR